MTLTDDQIRDLCRRRDAGIIAASAATNPHAATLVKNATPAELAQLIADGHQARNTLIEANMPLVTAIVRRTTYFAQHEQDYLQVGALALIHAVDRYDPNKGSLASYAFPRIKGAIRHLLDTHDGKMHLSRYQARSWQQIRNRTLQLQSAGLPTTPADIAKELGTTEDWVRSHANYQAPSTLTPSDDRTIHIPDTTTQEQIDTIGAASLAKYLRLLPPQERNTLELVHGFTGQPHTIPQAAEAMGIPAERVTRYVAAGHKHISSLLSRFDQQLTEGQNITTTARPAPSQQPEPGRPVAPQPGQLTLF